MCIRDSCNTNERKMQRRATSKKRAAEAEKELNMDDKEATPVEDIEAILSPAEPNRPAPTGDANFMEMMRSMMEETLNKNNEKLNKNIESLKEELSEKIDDNSKKMEEKIDDISKRIEENNAKIEGEITGDRREIAEVHERCEPVSYTHLDVYKRQLFNCLAIRRHRFCSTCSLG